MPISKAKSAGMFAVLLLILIAASFKPVSATNITRELVELGNSEYEAVFDITNDSLADPLGWFTIWFEVRLYETLQVGQNPTQWSPAVIQPDPGLPDDGFYDVFATVPDVEIEPGESLGGFTMRFTWLGSDPIPQNYFEIFSSDFSLIDSGHTVPPVPIPASLPLLFAALSLFGYRALRQRRRSRFATLALCAMCSPVLGIVLLGSPRDASAQEQTVRVSDIRAVQYQIAERKRINRFSFRYVFDVTFENQGIADYTGLTTTVRGFSGYSVERLFDGELGALRAGEGKTIPRAVSVTFDRRSSFRASRIQWRTDAPLVSSIEPFPAPVDFSEPYLGCREEQLLNVKNTGTVSVTIEDFRFDGFAIDSQSLDGFAWDQNRHITLNNVVRDFNGFLRFKPVALEPGESLSIPIAARLFAMPTALASVVIETSLPGSGGMFAVPITAAEPVIFGGYEATVDEFIQQSRAGDTIDVIFVLDRSGSMDGELQPMVERFSDFVRFFNQRGIDYRISVITAKDSCVISMQNFSDKYIDPLTPDEEIPTTFEILADPSQVLSPIVDTESEQGLKLISDALTPAKLAASGCNEGIMRPGSRLNIVHVSDEPEQSPQPWPFYVNRLAQVVADPADLRIHAIAGITPRVVAPRLLAAGFSRRLPQPAEIFCPYAVTGKRNWRSLPRRSIRLSHRLSRCRLALFPSRLRSTSTESNKLATGNCWAMLE